MTLVTGLVDAFSYLVLGHVFVANMTGNVVFLGFALAGAPGFSVPASLAAVAAFAVGALLGGRLVSRYSDHRGRLHSSAAASSGRVPGGLRHPGSPAAARRRPVTATPSSRCSASAMGIQNASARKIAVPDLTTTVLTLTITGIAADSTLAGGGGSKAGRRLVPVAAMLAGAFLGAALIRHAQAYYPLVIALVTIVAGAAVSGLLGRSDPPWVHPQPQHPPVPSPTTGTRGTDERSENSLRPPDQV